MVSHFQKKKEFFASCLLLLSFCFLRNYFCGRAYNAPPPPQPHRPRLENDAGERSIKLQYSTRLSYFPSSSASFAYHLQTNLSPEQFILTDVFSLSLLATLFCTIPPSETVFFLLGSFYETALGPLAVFFFEPIFRVWFPFSLFHSRLSNRDIRLNHSLSLVFEPSCCQRNISHSTPQLSVHPPPLSQTFRWFYFFRNLPPICRYARTIRIVVTVRRDEVGTSPPLPYI